MSSVPIAFSKFVYNVSGGKPVGSSLCVFKTAQVTKSFLVHLERSHVFSLWPVEKDLSPAALVVRFTKISLHNARQLLLSSFPVVSWVALN